MSYLIYGCYGYTGELIAREAKRRGQHPILAGRRPAPTQALAEELGFEHRSFGLEDHSRIINGLAGVSVVLHCAGPFSATSAPMSRACLAAGVHYLDITGEAQVFEALAAQDQPAKEAGVMLLPGVGFDVVPSDCLAAYVAGKRPGASALTIGVKSKGSLSRGTATTMIENIHSGGLVREAGVLTTIRSGSRARSIDFGIGPEPTICIPWGDVSTAFYSTKIPNIEVYFSLPWSARTMTKLSPAFGWILGSRPMQALLRRAVRAGKAGPTTAQRAQGGTIVWAEARDSEGAARALLSCPDGYELTVHAALEIVQRVLSGDAPAGFKTPSRAYGADLVLALDGVSRRDAD